MIEFIDKTPQESGTPLNRATMMALQGFIACTTVMNEDGSVTETNAKGETKTTIMNDDGSVVEIFEGQKTITKTTRIDGNIITEDIS